MRHCHWLKWSGHVMGCRYFLNSKCAWYADTFEGTFEISMTCLVVFSILVRAHDPIRQSTVGIVVTGRQLIALGHRACLTGAVSYPMLAMACIPWLSCAE